MGRCWVVGYGGGGFGDDLRGVGVEGCGEGGRFGAWNVYIQSIDDLTRCAKYAFAIGRMSRFRPLTP